VVRVNQTGVSLTKFIVKNIIIYVSK